MASVNLHKIGDFQFRWMSQPPLLARFTTTTIERAGTNNYAIFLTGLRGQAFDVETRLDTPTLAAAQAIYEQYHLSISACVPLIYAGRIYLGAQHKFLIQDVFPTRLRALKAGVGGVNGRFAFSRATVDVTWRLRAVQALIP